MHIAVGLAVAVTVGVLLTITVTDAMAEQVPLVPVTVYVIVDEGVTVLLEPVPNPLDQLYVLAPFAVKIELLPEQIVDGLAVIVITGVGFTVTVIVAVLEHDPLLPVTVYVVVDVGKTVILFPE